MPAEGGVKSFGMVFISKEPTISSPGKFSYDVK
jgi:hypothetical protein